MGTKMVDHLIFLPSHLVFSLEVYSLAQKEKAPCLLLVLLGYLCQGWSTSAACFTVCLYFSSIGISFSQEVLEMGVRGLRVHCLLM